MFTVSVALLATLLTCDTLLYHVHSKVQEKTSKILACPCLYRFSPQNHAIIPINKKTTTTTKKSTRNSFPFLLVLSIRYLPSIGIPALATIPANISLFLRWTLERGGIVYATPDSTGESIGPLAYHSSRNSYCQIFRERLASGKVRLYDTTLPSRKPENYLRNVFRNLNDAGKMFHVLNIARIMPAKKLLGHFCDLRN